MFKKIASMILINALACTLCGTVAFAQATTTPVAELNRAINPPDSGSAGKKEAPSEKNLKAEMQKLVADAKAGKGLSISNPQIQPKQSNSLSKGAKIGIVAGIAAAIILTILIVHTRNHLFDGSF